MDSVEYNFSELYWKEISLSVATDKTNFSMEFLRKFKDFLLWDIIFSKRKFTILELKKISRIIDWDLYSMYNTYDEKLYKAFKQNNRFLDSIDITHSVIKEKFFKKTKLSKLITTTKNKIYRFSNFNLSSVKNLLYSDIKDFIIDETDYKYLIYFLYNAQFSMNLLNAMIKSKYFDSYKFKFWRIISRYQNIHPEFGEKYINKINWRVYFKLHSHVPYLQNKFINNPYLCEFLNPDYKKCIFLQEKILDFLYKPEGRMYIKTKNHFESLCEKMDS